MVVVVGPSSGREEAEGRRPLPSLAAGVIVDHPGILPIGTSSFWLSPDSKVGGWGLPGHGHARADCGSFITLGCLDAESHFQEALDGPSIVGKVFIKHKKISCKNPGCPICYENWAAREAHRIEHRMSAYRLRGARPIHFIVSVPSLLWDQSEESLRPKSYSVSKRVGFLGGSCLYHPFRQVEDTKQWYFSPHFHMIGYGWIKGAGQEYISSGWICKNLGVRESVYATAFYQLTHCGVWYGPGRRHSVTWFGALSYNKLQVPPEEVKDVCPICGSGLVRVCWRGEGPPPISVEAEGEFWCDPEGWLPSAYRGWS